MVIKKRFDTTEYRIIVDGQVYDRLTKADIEAAPEKFYGNTPYTIESRRSPIHMWLPYE